MNTERCEQCGDAAPAPLLRTIELSVDSDRIDAQTLCPECFSDWISRYQAEMASEMAQSNADSEVDVGSDITIAEETEPTAPLGTGNNALDRAVANAENRDDSKQEGTASDKRTDIREVGGKPPQGPSAADDDDQIDSDSESDRKKDEEDDSSGLF